MRLPEPYRGKLTTAGQVLALSLGYVVLGRLGLAISPLSSYAAPFWPPTGIALAALFLGGYRLWPGVAIGALVTALWMGNPPPVAVSITVGNTLEALFGVLALRKIPGFRGSLDRFQDVVGLAVLAAVLSPLFSATVGAVSLTLSGSVAKDQLLRTWITWWTGDLVSVLLVAPALLTWAARPRSSLRRGQIVEAIALGLVLVVGSALIFGQPVDVTGSAFLSSYMLFLPLIWVALRFGVRGAATGTLLVATFAVWGTYTGRGALVRADVVHSLLTLHVFLVAMSLSTLALGAVISEREHSRLLLDKSESLLRSVIHGTMDAVYVKDVLGRYVIMNAPGARLFGLPSEEIMGKDDFALFSADEARVLRELDREVMEKGLPVDSNEHLTIAGQTRIYHTTKVAYRDHAGRLLGVIGISRDITERQRVERELQKLEERRRVEKELRELEERQRLAVEAAHLGTWFWDLKTDELVCSAPTRKILGIPEGEAVSYQRLVDAVHPDERATVDRLLRRSITEPESYRHEHRVVWPDGSVHWVSGSGGVFHDEAGAPERMLGVLMDITVRKRAEEEHAELLRRERAARAEAQAAGSAKDEFLAVLSHELRTPLQSMLGWTQMLREKRVDEVMLQKGLATIERNVKTQTQLIEDLLDISRIVAGTIRVDRRPMRLGLVVDAALALAALPAGAKSIRVEAAIDPDVGELFGDPDRLEQVINNLVANAIKFTPAGGRIGVRLDRVGDAARLVIEDSGHGITTDFLPHVFERFRQADSTTRRSHGGLGLGLSIVRHIVEIHGGEVVAESPGEDRGATFTVTLPLANGADDHPAAPASPSDLSRPATRLAGHAPRSETPV